MDVTGRVEDERDTAALGSQLLRPQAVVPGTPGADVLVGTPQADQIDALGGDDDVRGLAGNDTILGRDGNDVLRGGPGADDIRGGPGNDTVVGGGGEDRLTGGSGEDLLRGKAAADDLAGGDDNDVLRGGGGNDTLSGDAGDDLLVGGGGNDELRGSQGDDTLRGRAGDDILLGGIGNDTLRGEAGADLLEGRGGNDTLVGGPGADELVGGSGNDILDGKDAQDIMTGGPGADVFTYTKLDDSVDRILDFTPNEDRFDLSAILPGFGAGSDLDLFVDFEVVPEGTILSVDPGGSGDFQRIAGLEGVSVPSLSAGDLGLAQGLPSAPTVISTNLAGDLANATAFAPSLSDDGTFVTFASLGDNLVSGDNNDAFDIFRKNLTTGEVVKVSQISLPGQGVQAADDDSFFSSISADGTVVAFDSEADNFSNIETGTRNVFVTTVGSNAVDLVSIVNNQQASGPSLSGDGERVAFTATATGRAETDNPAPVGTIMRRVFVRDLSDGSLTEASTAENGDFANAPSRNAEISANGNFVAFQSTASNLAGVDANLGTDVFVKSLVDGSIAVASTTAAGVQAVGNSTAPSISADGRFVAFQSQASFVAEDTGGNDIYLKDLQTGAITLVSINQSGIKGNGGSFTPSISDDGRFVAFRSFADNLVAGDNNNRADVFVADTQTGEFLRFALASDTSDARRDLVEPTLSGDGNLVAFVDQVSVGANGGLTGGQVVVAPVDFGAGALSVADLLSSDLEPLAGEAIASADPGASLAPAAQPIQTIAPAADTSALLVQPDIV